MSEHTMTPPMPAETASRSRAGSYVGHSRALVYAAMLLTLGAALIHLAVAPQHFEEYLPYGFFFVVVGAGQIALALALIVTPTRRLFVVGLTPSLGLIALWALSRTVGAPIGPDGPWHPEPMGLPDIMCTILELLAAPLFLTLTIQRPRPRRRRPVRLALATAPTFLLVALLTFVGVGTARNDMPVAFNAAPAVAGQRSTSVTSLTQAPGPEPVRAFTLTAEEVHTGGQVAWTFNGTVPGPELHVVQGDRVRVTLVNHLPVSTTLHWHGVAVPNAEDGVAGITQDAVRPGATYTYEFAAHDAGSYWYHSHQDTATQLGRGLFGALIVEPASGHVAEAHEYTIMLHSTPSGSQMAANGTVGDLRFAARPGEQVRLRLINAFPPSMDGGPVAPVLLGAPYRVVALDGHDLNQPQPLAPERLALGMGQRADIVFTMPQVGAVRLVATTLSGQASAIQKFFPATALWRGSAIIGDGTIPAVGNLNQLPLFDMTRYGSAAADAVANAHFDATYPIVLDETPGFRAGSIELVHTINGQSSPYVPPITVRQGQVIHLHIVNRTGEFHPMHIHGHIFSVLALNGTPIQGSPIHLDSILVGPHETWDVVFLANNPGIWMLHCHVLLHASFGMSMTINYAGITTPFEMGSRSGNMPE